MSLNFPQRVDARSTEDSSTWKAKVQALAASVRLIWRVARHPRSPWPARLIAFGAAAYILSPIQLIPTFLPVIGQMDDLLVLYLAHKWTFKLVPADVLAECREPRSAWRGKEVGILQPALIEPDNKE